MVSVAISPHGLQTTRTLDEGSAATLVQSQLAQCTGVTGMPEPLARNCTEGVARDDSRRINVAISASGNNGQHEFSNTRPSKQLSLPLQKPYFTTLIFNFAHFQGLSTLPFLKGESRLTIGTQRTDLMAPRQISSTGDPTTEGSRLGIAVYGVVNFGCKQAHHIIKGVQLGDEVCLKENNMRIRDRLTHTLTNTTTSRVMFTPCIDL